MPIFRLRKITFFPFLILFKRIESIDMTLCVTYFLVYTWTSKKGECGAVIWHFKKEQRYKNQQYEIHHILNKGYTVTLFYFDFISVQVHALSQFFHLIKSPFS